MLQYFRIPQTASRMDRRGVSNVLRAAVLLVAVVAGGAACRTVSATAPIERPALDVPPPPPRVIIPIPGPVPPRLEPVEELPVTTEKSPTRGRANRDKTDPGKPDPKIEPVEPPAPPPAPVVPPLRLENPNAAQLSNQVRDTLARARAIIDGIERNSLGSEPRKKAYDQAKLFAEEAEDAIQKNNLVYAKEVAEKAERLASSIK